MCFCGLYILRVNRKTVTELHTLNNTVAKGFNQMAPLARTITVALDMSKAFDTINMHTVIRKLLHNMYRYNHEAHRKLHQGTQNQHYIHKSHIHTTSALTTDVSQGGVHSSHYLTFTLQTYHHPENRFRSCLTQINITITSTLTSTSAAKTYLQPYLHKKNSWTKYNNLTLNPDKTTCTLLTPDPVENKYSLQLKINNTTIPMVTHTKILGIYLIPKTRIQHIHSQHLNTR